jgi:hypothetical protein
MIRIALLALALAEPKNPNVVAGEAAYREGRWDDASVAFAAAYDETGDPIFLYTRAQSERRAGRCKLAIELYTQFLATEPPEKSKQVATRYRDECKALLPAPEPAPAPPPVVEPASDTPDQPSPPPRPWWRDPAGGVLVGIGGAGVVTGAVLVGLAYGSIDRASSASDDLGYDARVQRAHRFEIAGGTVLAVGSALLVGGVVRWLVVRSRSAGSRDRAPGLARSRSRPRSR